MSFNVDRQTLDDLNIFGKRGRNSIYSLFNRTYTRGGAEVLERMFRYPLSDVDQINQRSAIIQFFHQLDTAFPISAEWFDAMELYMENYDERTKLRSDGDTVGRKFNSLVGADTHFKGIQNGVTLIAKTFTSFSDFVKQLDQKSTPTAYLAEIENIQSSLSDPELIEFSKKAKNGKLAYAAVAEFDQLVRFDKRETVLRLFNYIYQLDVYMAIANVARSQGYAYPKALTTKSHEIHLKGVYHPLVPNAVGNDLSITPEKNIVFLTGANMAGKSTFMKSLGISIFLAHIGFPVPAKHMEFTVREGLFTTINLSDNLNMGYSHFYAEVLRVKQVSEQLAQGSDLFVIFDELFRGTNVKDAYEATVAITEAYAKKLNCMFVVSTHIIEAADELKEKCSNINYVYLPTIMEGSVPKYTYTLKEGVTADRHGMVIISNEKILELLEEGVKQYA